MVDVDKQTYRLLKKLYKVQQMEEQELLRFMRHPDPHQLEPSSHFLLRNGMITCYDVCDTPDGEGGYINGKRYYKIALPGKAYVEKQKSILHDKRVANIRYIITTVIAVSALILSLAALLWQWYTWTYEIHRDNADSSFSFSSDQDGKLSTGEQPEPPIEP